MTDPLRPDLNRSLTKMDGWEIVEGARLATRSEFKEALPIGMMVTNVLAQLMVLAADKSGRIPNYDPVEVFDTHIMTALDAEPDDLATPVRYDTFTAMVMAESVLFLVSAGYLAHRGGGDHAAYHLALPGPDAP